MKIHEIEQVMQEATTAHDLQRALTQYLQSFGLTAFAFTLYLEHPKTGSPLQYDCVSAPLKAWHHYYLEQKYADVDQTLAALSRSILPIYWNIQAQIAQAKNTREKRLREESQAYGIDQGLLIPIHGPDKDFACLCLHQMRGEKGLVEAEIHQYEWQMATLIFYHHLKKLLLNNIPRKTSALSKRETQCLLLTKQGFNVDDIASQLAISVATVNFHLQNCNKKLGVKNKYQAVLKWEAS